MKSGMEWLMNEFHDTMTGNSYVFFPDDVVLVGDVSPATRLRALRQATVFIAHIGQTGDMTTLDRSRSIWSLTQTACFMPVVRQPAPSNFATASLLVGSLMAHFVSKKYGMELLEEPLPKGVDAVRRSGFRCRLRKKVRTAS